MGHGIPIPCIQTIGHTIHYIFRVRELENKTSPPEYPQSNGKEESAVKTAKMLMERTKKPRYNPYLT